MSRSRVACLFFLATVFTSLAIAVPECVAKDPVADSSNTSAWCRCPAPANPHSSGMKVPTPRKTCGAEPSNHSSWCPAGKACRGELCPYDYNVASPTIAVPAMPGVTNGVIGPPSGPGVVFAETEISTTRTESPVIPMLLFGSLASSLIFVGVRFVVQKKRAPLFVLGLIAAGTLMLVGFSRSFYEPVAPGVARAASKPIASENLPILFRCGTESPSDYARGVVRVKHDMSKETATATDYLAK